MPWSDVVIHRGDPKVVTETMFGDVRAWYVRAAVNGDVIAAVAQTGGPCTVVDSLGHRWAADGPAFGQHCCGIAAHPQDWVVTWMEDIEGEPERTDGRSYGIAVLDLDLREVSRVSKPYPFEATNPQGFLDAPIGQEPIWTDHHRTVDLGGATLGLWLRRGDWTLGQDWHAHRLLAYRHSTGDLYVAWVGKTYTASALAVDASGRPWVLPALHTTIVDRSDFQPYTPPPFVDEPPTSVPFFDTPDHPMSVQIFGGPGFRMNLGAAHDRDPAAAPSGAFVTIDHDPEAAFDRQVEYARQHGVPLFEYIDQNANEWTLARLRQVPGVRCVAAVKTYPDKPLDQIGREIERLSRAGREIAVVVAGYRQMIGHGPTYNWTLDQVIPRAASVWQEIRRNAHVRHVLIFHQRRQGELEYLDGLDSRPELQRMADLMRAASSAYRPPDPTPTPEPDPPDWPDPDDSPEPPDPIDLLRTSLQPGEVLTLGEWVESPNGRTRLTLQHDGNVVLTLDGLVVRWASGTEFLDVSELVMQGSDGNLVLYDDDSASVWSSGTQGNPGAVLYVRDDGRAQIVRPDGLPLWTVMRAPGQAPRPDAPMGGVGSMRRPNIWKWIKDHILRPILGRGDGDRRKNEIRRPPSNPTPQPDPPVEPDPPPPAVVLPPLRHHSLDDVRSLVLSGRLNQHLVPHNPEPFVRAVLAELNDPNVGWHMRGVGRRGGGVIAYNVTAPGSSTPYQIFDIVHGGEGPTPKANWLDQTPTLEAGSRFDPFVLDEVPRLSTLPRVTVDGTRFVAGGQPWRWIGATSFDLPVRIRGYGDLRFADWLRDEGFTVANLVPASVNRTPRTLLDGTRDLPRSLAELHVRSLYAQVILGVDLRAYGASRQEFRSWVIDILEILAAHSNTLAQMMLEATHGMHPEFARDRDFLSELVAEARVRGITCASASSHGGEDIYFPEGDYLSHHSNRSRPPEENIVELVAMRDRFQMAVADDEPIGTAEAARPGSRTADPGYAERQARLAVQHGIGATWHSESGLYADVDRLGDIQRRSARRFIAAMRA